jgi:hypothetical protein
MMMGGGGGNQMIYGLGGALDDLSRDSRNNDSDLILKDLLIESSSH